MGGAAWLRSGYVSVKTRRNIPALLEIMSCGLSDDNQLIVVEVKVFSPMEQKRWIDLQRKINEGIVGYGTWVTVLSAVLAPGYVTSDVTSGTPSDWYLVDIYANRTAMEAYHVVEIVQTEICHFLNLSTAPPSHVNVVFTKRFAQPSPSVVEGTNAPNDNSRVFQLERDVRTPKKNLASKL